MLMFTPKNARGMVNYVRKCTYRKVANSSRTFSKLFQFAK